LVILFFINLRLSRGLLASLASYSECLANHSRDSFWASDKKGVKRKL
jgi:hypothetical protein